MSELKVITSAKKLMSYVLVVTNTADKKYRFTFVQKMHNCCIEIVENLYLANQSLVGSDNRKEYQNIALAKLKFLDYICSEAKDIKCICFRQFQNISSNIFDCINLLVAWINSDNNRKDGEVL